MRVRHDEEECKLTRVTIDQIPYGTTFKYVSWQKGYFMRVYQGDDVDAVDLETGELVKFHKDERLYQVEAEVVINKGGDYCG